MFVFLIAGVITFIIVSFFMIKYSDHKTSFYDLLTGTGGHTRERPSQKPRHVFLEIKKHYGLRYPNADYNLLSGTIDNFGIEINFNERQQHFFVTIESPKQTKPRYHCTIKYGGGYRKMASPQSTACTGDTDFDGMLGVTGLNDTEILAFLDSNTRHLFMRIIRNTNRFVFTPEKTEFSIYMFPVDYSPSSVIEMIEGVIGLSKRVMREDNLRARLINNISCDDVPGVRLRSLRVMIERFPDDPILSPVLKRVLFDPSREVALFALKRLGREGVEYIYDTLKRLRPQSSIHADHISTAVELLFEKEGKTCLNAVIACYPQCTSLQEKQKLVALIAMYGGDTGLEFLILLLQNSESGMLESVIEILGEKGTAAAVGPLKSISKNMMHPVYVREKAKDAMRNIKRRIGPKETGMLSLPEAEGDGGGLSLAETDGDEGGLSLTDTPVDGGPGSQKKAEDTEH
ncbi:MAG: hypothetical protein JW881_14935 [Spirochaetales bacterium]|nr:hypothetical protein [Spirochaetales bacterium]